MAFEFYVVIVTLAALVYSLATRLIQEKLTDRKFIDEVQSESKKLNEELKKAKERNDKKRIDDLTKKQMALLPKMKKMFFGQMKVLAVVLILFLVVSWGVTTFDPNIKDDIIVELKDDGSSCDDQKDGIFTGCYDLNGENYGEWSVTIQSFNKDQQSSQRILYFLFNSKGKLQAPSGDLEADTEKNNYDKGELLKIIAKPKKADVVKATLDNGTSFFVDLPFTIPILNTQRISGSYWWFIAVTVVSGLIFSYIIREIKKSRDKK